MSRLSLCMIARDEEALLPGCLASVEGVVDEIVLVDTGSRDATPEIARGAGARVFSLPWRDDFAEARNASIARATGDWILVLDADERLAPGAGRALRAALGDRHLDVGLLPLHNAVRLDADPAKVVAGVDREGTPMRLPRLLRNVDGLAYQGVVHESVAAWLVRRGSRAVPIDADIVHLGHVPSLRQARGKHERNAALLRRRCELEPHDVEPFGYLAGELLQAGDDAGARAAAEAGWALVDRQPPSRSLHRLAALRAILALRAGDPARALESVSRAEARQEPHLDFHFLRGCALDVLALAEPPDGPRRRELSSQAAACYAAAVAARRPPPLEQFAEGADAHQALGRMGDALLLAGDPRGALAAFEEALAEAPAYAKALLGRAESRLDLGEPAAALELLEPLLDDRPDGWTLAASAAGALKAESEARLFLRRADERRGTGFSSLHRRDRHAALHRMLDPPAAGQGARAEPTARRLAVTVVSPPGYVHSQAFHEVAEAIHQAFRALGHDSVLGSDPALPGRRHVVFGANLAARLLTPLRPGSILFNLEQVAQGSSWITPELLELYRRFPVWDYSRANADALERMGVPRPRVVPIGWVPELTRIAPAEEDIDVLFYGSLNARRQAVLEELARRRFRVEAAYGVYGAERDRLVARAKLVLNVHFYEAKVFEIVRVSYLLANRRAVVSERGCDAAEEAPFEAGVAFAEYAGLPGVCEYLLAHPEERRRLGEAGYAIMAARPQAAFLREALADLG